MTMYILKLPGDDRLRETGKNKKHKKREKREKRTARVKKDGSAKRFVKTLIIAIVIIVLAIAGYLFVKLGNLSHVDIDEDNLASGKIDGYKNIVVLGVDTRDMSNYQGSRTDSIIIVSINQKNGKIKLISVYRDSLLDIEEVGLDKVTHAFAYGGPERTMNTLNRNLDLDITDFAALNFRTVQKMVDDVGGIDVKIEENEIDQMNTYLPETAKYLKTDYEPITEAGKQHLNGVEAVTYSRIRHTEGGDYKRTERMRTVFTAVFKEVKSNPLSINKIMNDVLPEINTNMSRAELMPLLLTLARMDITDSIGWPYDKEGWTGASGTWYAAPVTLQSNVVKLHQEVFEQEDYEPSSEVENISYNISTTTGYYGN